MSPAGLATAVVLGGWAGAFWFLLVTGRWSLYLSTRTRWVVPVGAALLSGAAIGKLVTLRGDSPEPLGRSRSWALAGMAAPVLLILVLPPATLGSFSAGRRASFVGAGVTSSAAEVASGSISMLDVGAAQTSNEGLDALESRAGEQVTLVGFVVRQADTPADEILLTRYIVTCCVADATIAQVRVVDVPAGRFSTDQWVQVTGRIYPLGREVIVDATSVVGVPRPTKPYLTP